MSSISFFAVFAAIYVSAFAQDSPHTNICRWRSETRSLYCQGKKLRSIPYGIPVDTLVLHLQENFIENWSRSGENLSPLQSLKQLDMYYNNLTSMPSDLPSTLEIINLQNNQIKYVGGTSLEHLNKLEMLSLSFNNITNVGLSASAFQSTKSLRVLELRSNKLSEFPDSLPSSLKHLSLENNKIVFISSKATQNLKQLINLFLSGNSLRLSSLQHRALAKLTSLKKLDLSHNFLSEIPPDLPRCLVDLRLRSNQIEYLYKSETAQHGSLASLRGLTSVDLSSNFIKSVEPGTFFNIHLNTIEIQENPWQCDCHLHYFVQWLQDNKPTLSRANDTSCGSPENFKKNQLEKVTLENLQCLLKNEKQSMIKVVDVAPTEFTLQWKSGYQRPDPPFVKLSINYGPLNCGNCTLLDYEKFDFTFEKNSIPFMESISTKIIATNNEYRQKERNITIKNLQPDYRYAVCVFNSQQSDRKITETNCVIVKTPFALNFPKPVQQEIAIFLPVWSVVLCSGIFLFFIIILIITVLVRKRNKKLRSKTPNSPQLTNRTDVCHQEDPLLAIPRIPFYSRPSTNQCNYPTYISDRTYAECGPAETSSTTTTTLRDFNIDVCMEGEVAVNSESKIISPQRVTRNRISTESDRQETTSASTSGTRLSSSNHSSAVSSPTYDLLHCYKPKCQLSRARTTSFTDRPATDSGISI